MNEYLILIFAFLPAIVAHEVAHGYVAYLLGDPTAKNEGRLTLNPLKHLSFLGTLAIFLVHIGWAKPVPINPHYFKNPRKDIALCSLAGPMANFALALISGWLITILNIIGTSTYIAGITEFLMLFLFINCILMVFNLIPLPPLDGASVISYFFPKKMWEYWNHFEKNGVIILIILIAVQSVFNIPIFHNLVLVPADKIKTFVLLISGIN